MLRRRVLRGVWSAVLAWAWANPATLGDPGPLVLVGGALDPANEAIYRSILDRALPGQPICVLPTASARPKRSMKSYVKDFRSYGGSAAGRGVAITTARPRRAASPKIAADLADCGGFFFTGGDQSRIVDVLRPGGKPTLADAAIRERWRAGAVIAGTSAGAAMMSDPMIGGGSSTDAFEHGVTAVEEDLGVWVRNGMRFLPSTLIDQHCLARGRLGRLLVAVTERTEHDRGLCIDEDTALVVEGEEARVVGTSGVAVLDLERARPAGERGFRGGRLWLLGDGDRLRFGDGARPEAGKRAWPSLSLEAHSPTDPWVQNNAHKFLLFFALAGSESANLGTPPAGIRLRKSTDFRTLARGDGHPVALFAGPFEVDWVPGEATR